MLARLSIVRQVPDGVRDRVVHLWLDGERWDRLAYGTTLTRSIAPGRHVVKAHNTLVSTTDEFEAAPGEEVRRACVNGLTGGGRLVVLMPGVACLRVRLTRLLPAPAGDTGNV